MTMLETCWNFLDFTHAVVNFAEPVDARKLGHHVLEQDEALQSMLHLFNVEGVTQHFITFTEGSSFYRSVARGSSTLTFVIMLKLCSMLTSADYAQIYARLICTSLGVPPPLGVKCSTDRPDSGSEIVTNGTINQLLITGRNRASYDISMVAVSAHLPSSIVGPVSTESEWLYFLCNCNAH